MDSKIPITTFRKILSFDPLKNESKAIELAISKKNNTTTVNIDRIIYLKSNSSYTVIHMDDGTKIVSSTTLKKYADKLGNESFLQVHPSYLINKSSISCYMANQNKIILHNSQEIPVSNSKKEGLLNYLKTLMV
ncbi:LytR/AlgR family response regulator transcription factor [Portibacter lacus]|uniref:HTH LytTR-type domain-containing protein n=1 Tax=Portibacter lacus TaxID=1099794 RepID=A0AA37WE01_9BACT|nr:LytTR family DNA-binding domain-containing protein [Portibacter lacus]GLR17458.1 hypothetical protein GCM10007940_20730 [Portibacter lacus]